MLGHSLQSIQDRMGSITPPAIRAPAFGVIALLQGQDPAVQVTAIGVALCAVAEAIGMDMEHVIYVCENTLRDAEGPYTEHIQAIREYAKGELLGKNR